MATNKNLTNTGKNRRRYPRVPLNILVQFRSPTLSDFANDYARNISIGGLFVETTKVKPLGTELFFQFTLDEGGTLIEGLGKVVHVSTAPGQPQGMGIEFVSVLEPSRSIINKIVEDRIHLAE
jgi:uncharacterized protein (TIGR02266 family)